MRAAFLALSVLVLLPNPLLAAGLAAHEALYELSVGRVKYGAATESGSGQFLLRVQRRCDGWLLVTRMDFDIVSAGGREIQMESSSSVEESLDGRSMRFTQESRINGEIVDELVGRAVLPPADSGATGRVLFDKPEGVRLDLPPETMFPISATAWSIEEYRKGRKVVSYMIFDGGSADGPYVLSDVVTGDLQPLEELPQGDTALLAGIGWRVIASFFKFGAADAEPLFTQSGEIYENGVITKATLDLGVLEAEARLARLRALPAPSC